MNFGQHSQEEYFRMAESFHGRVAPGLIIGGIMITMAQERVPKDSLYDVICETSYCLPDAAQLLTPCTIGNGWLRVVDLGRFALTLYDKQSGDGIRVFLDKGKIDKYDEIKNWFLKLKPKKEQDSNQLLEQILDAGREIYSINKVRVQPQLLSKRSKGSIAICAACGEAYPAKHGATCLACQGQSPYLTAGKNP
ncbi:MAG: formylmethanofuran dehydrogenase subunit E family protein [bacterium]|nr:formylmethanofuran dehydrogenase subunit E family protein [bacterium]